MTIVHDHFNGSDKRSVVRLGIENSSGACPGSVAKSLDVPEGQEFNAAANAHGIDCPHCNVKVPSTKLVQKAESPKVSFVRIGAQRIVSPQNVKIIVISNELTERFFVVDGMLLIGESSLYCASSMAQERRELLIFVIREKDLRDWHQSILTVREKLLGSSSAGAESVRSTMSSICFWMKGQVSSSSCIRSQHQMPFSSSSSRLL